MAFADVSKLPTVTERRAELMRRLEHVWEQAMGRTYTNKHGDEMPNPDNATALRVVEVADVLMNEADEKQKKRGQLVEMAIFNTQKRTG
jgi:nitroimidazol reductase NimA-like FMN-containing flavoprotein (pyridoxamine 5'-phosphate oxidase superfamily)